MEYSNIPIVASSGCGINPYTKIETNTENPIRTVEVSKVPVQLLNANALSDQGIALVPNQNIYVDLKVEGYSQDVYKLNKDEFLIQIDLLFLMKLLIVNVIFFPK